MHREEIPNKNMKKKSLETLVKMLTETELTLADARIRDAFIRSLPLKAFQEDREKIAQKFCKKNDDGQPVIVDDKYSIEDIENFNKELLIFIEEEVTGIKITDEIKKFINNSSYKLKVGEAEIIDELLK